MVHVVLPLLLHNVELMSLHQRHSFWSQKGRRKVCSFRLQIMPIQNQKKKGLEVIIRLILYLEMNNSINHIVCMKDNIVRELFRRKATFSPYIFRRFLF